VAAKSLDQHPNSHIVLVPEAVTRTGAERVKRPPAATVRLEATARPMHEPVMVSTQRHEVAEIGRTTVCPRHNVMCMEETDGAATGKPAAPVAREQHPTKPLIWVSAGRS
jgi:hypothetical protein